MEAAAGQYGEEAVRDIGGVPGMLSQVQPVTRVRKSSHHAHREARGVRGL